MRFTNDSERVAGLDRRIEAAERAFAEEAQLTESIQAADPQLVLVFEALDERTDLTAVALRLGFELLLETEGAIDPDDDVQLVSTQARDPQIGTCIHAVCVNSASMERILTAWRGWKETRSVEFGYGPLGELFGHLRDVHAWGPEDRLRAIDWDEYFAGQIPEQSRTIEIELWYRGSGADRLTAVQDVTALVEQSGGEVIASADIASIGYLAVKCIVPDELLRRLAAGDFENALLIKSSHVLYLKAQGQGLLPEIHDEPVVVDAGSALPSLPARVVLLDGVPASNHQLLAGRVQVNDPDDLSSDSEATVEDRRHGTWMSSAVVWGDLNAHEAPLDRFVLVRPVITPSPDTVQRTEEFRDLDLVPDTMRRVFAELFGPGSQFDDLTIVNISLGDPALPFDSIMSSWARILDWLSYEYGVLVVVSAGNYRDLHLVGNDSASIQLLSGVDRSNAILEAQNSAWASRRMIAPAESINALTVGALHDDASGLSPSGYSFDPHDGLLAVSPITGLGGGHRRAVKPDVAAPGGRVAFRDTGTPSTRLQASGAAIDPGIRVASPASGRAANIVGTSPAAALVSRRLSKLVDLADQIADRDLSRHERAVAAKALLVHGARHPDSLRQGFLPLRSSIGYGAIERDLAEGCGPNEATILYLGELGALEQQELLFPLPDGLNVREIKRVTATLAWLSPVNWRHRQYRRASLGFSAPAGLTKLPSAIDLTDEDSKRGSATVKHLAWEINSAVSAGLGDQLSLKVKCFGQAGGLGEERVHFAAAISLWVAPTLGIDIYTQVAQQIQPRVKINPRG
jgi:hypothetical protein